MSSRPFPGLGLVGGRPAGESGWAAEMNSNLLQLSSLTNLKVISRIAAVPGSPVDGDTYILTSAPNINTVAVRDNGAWVYLTPKTGWRAFDNNTGKFIYFNGTTWVDEVSLTSLSTPGMTFLSKIDISNNASVEFTTGIDSTYDVYKCILRGVAGNSAISARLRVGGAWYAGSSDYSQQANFGTVVDNSSSFLVGNANSSVANSGCSGELLFSAITGRNKSMLAQTVFNTNTSSPATSTIFCGGQCKVGSGRVDGVRFFTSGNLLEGSIYLYGLKTSA